MTASGDVEPSTGGTASRGDGPGGSPSDGDSPSDGGSPSPGGSPSDGGSPGPGGSYGPGASFARILAGRRMCRDFLPDMIPPHVLEQVLAASFRGPSAGNTAGLELLVLDGERIEQYWDVTLSGAARTTFRWPGLLLAPTLVIPLVAPDAYLERYGRDDKVHTGLGGSVDSWSVPYWFVDGGAAVMALLLAAEAAGLGSLFFGQFQHEAAVAGRFSVPAELRALGTVALGYSAPGGRRPSMSASAGRPEWSAHCHRGSFGERW